MTQVKAVVSLLCDLLQFMGIGDLKPEIFRCAKFNKTTAEGPLVRSLRKVLQVHFKSTGEPGFDTKEEEMVFVSREMMRRGYLKANFYKQLENLYKRNGHVQEVDGHLREQDSHAQESESSCSRDLLLALVWLLHKMKIFENYSAYVRYCIVCLTQSLPSLTTIRQIEDTVKNLFGWWKWMKEQYQLSQHHILHKSEKKSRDKSDCHITSLIQQVLTVRNRIVTTARALYSAESGYAKLSNKVHMVTQKATPKHIGLQQHLSLNEVYLLRHPDLLKKSVRLLGKLSERLEKLVMWTDQEILFWQWMESVIDVKQAEEQDQSHALCRMATRDTTISVTAATTQFDLSVRQPFLWCVHLQWALPQAKKSTVCTQEGERCCLAVKIKEVDTNIIKLETQLKELHDRYLSDIEHLKSRFLGITFETTDLKIRTF